MIEETEFIPIDRGNDHCVNGGASTPTKGKETSNNRNRKNSNKGRKGKRDKSKTGKKPKEKAARRDKTAGNTVLALKNNLLYDLALAPNIEIEIPVGKRWSVNLEYKSPWWSAVAKKSATS